MTVRQGRRAKQTFLSAGVEEVPVAVADGPSPEEEAKAVHRQPAVDAEGQGCHAQDQW